MSKAASCGPGCEATPSTASGVLAESHPSREQIAENANCLAARFDPAQDETQLLISEKDQALSWRELDDATLGRFARYFIIMAGHAEQRRADKDEWPMLALRSMHGGIALCRMTQEINAETYTLTLDGIRDGGGPMGDWEITIKRLLAPRDSDGSPQGEKPQALSAQHDSAARRDRPSSRSLKHKDG